MQFGVPKKKLVVQNDCHGQNFVIAFTLWYYDHRWSQAIARWSDSDRAILVVNGMFWDKRADFGIFDFLIDMID